MTKDVIKKFAARRLISQMNLHEVIAFLRGDEPITERDRTQLADLLEKTSRRLDNRKARDRLYNAKSRAERGGAGGREPLDEIAKWGLFQNSESMIEHLIERGMSAKEAHEEAAKVYGHFKNGESLRKALAAYRKRQQR